MVQLRSMVFYSREERARWWHGPTCLRCLKLRMVGSLGGLMMTPRRSSGCGACIPELSTRRHRGPLLCLGSRAKASTLEGRHRRLIGGSAFHMSFRGFLSLLTTRQKWYHHLQQSVQRGVQRLGRAGIRQFRPRRGHRNSPFRGSDYMIPCMVSKLAQNLPHLTRGLVKSVPGRGYFRAVPSQNGDKYVTSPPPSIVELARV